MINLAKSNHGSRNLQKFFPRASQSDIDIFIKEIQGKLDELMIDSYANYMFQTLAQSCSAEQRYFLLEKIAPNMIKIACHKKGTHALQAITQLISRETEEVLMEKTIKGHVLELSFDAQGTHLIQKLIASMSLIHIKFMYNEVISHIVEVANNSFGLCVLKDLMTKVQKVQKARKTIIKLINENVDNLIQNPFGNYIIQHALEIYFEDCNVILEKILNKVIQFSNQKFSSNVVEKCIISMNIEFRKRFISEISTNERLSELMKNKYGSYVLTKILSTADYDEKTILISNLTKNIDRVNISKNKYPKQWLIYLEEYVKHNFKITSPFNVLKINNSNSINNDSGRDNLINFQEQKHVGCYQEVEGITSDQMIKMNQMQPMTIMIPTPVKMQYQGGYNPEFVN